MELSILYGSDKHNYHFMHYYKTCQYKNLARFLPEFGEISPKNSFGILMQLSRLETMRSFLTKKLKIRSGLENGIMS